MAREIPLEGIADYLQESIRLTVVATVLEAEGRIKSKTPVKTGRLRNAWVSEVPKRGLFGGAVTNNVVYAEPVVYGTNLPPSWGGEYRTQQNTTPGYPDLIAKELEPWAKDRFQEILRR
jgi:hypothetical protein